MFLVSLPNGTPRWQSKPTRPPEYGGKSVKEMADLLRGDKSLSEFTKETVTLPNGEAYGFLTAIRSSARYIYGVRMLSGDPRAKIVVETGESIARSLHFSRKIKAWLFALAVRYMARLPKHAKMKIHTIERSETGFYE